MEIFVASHSKGIHAIKMRKVKIEWVDVGHESQSSKPLQQAAAIRYIGEEIIFDNG